MEEYKPQLPTVEELDSRHSGIDEEAHLYGIVRDLLEFLNHKEENDGA